MVDASAFCVDVALNGAAIGADLMRSQADPAAPVPGRHKLTRPQATAGSFCVRFVRNVVQRVTAVRYRVALANQQRVKVDKAGGITKAA